MAWLGFRNVNVAMSSFTPGMESQSVYAGNGIPKRNRLPHLRIQATPDLPIHRRSLLLEKAATSAIVAIQKRDVAAGFLPEQSVTAAV